MPLPPTVDLAQRDTVRLVSTGRLKAPALLPLVADDRALDDLASLESATNARLRAEEAGLAELDPRELVFGRAGHTFVNAAFTHTRPGGNRFNDDGRGAWYARRGPRSPRWPTTSPASSRRSAASRTSPTTPS
jgi:hypothetical protein